MQPTAFAAADTGRSTTVLVACSCAIAMATPITVLAAVGRTARHGIVIKGGRYLEALAKVDTLVVDKTGTLTVGRPDLTDIVALPGHDGDTVLSLAAAVERRSEHPLAAGILRAAERRGLALDPIAAFSVRPGEGVTATVRDRRVACGTERLMGGEGIAVPPHVQTQCEALAAAGKSVVLVANDERIVGLLALADTVRPHVDAALRRLRVMGIERQILLTGDRQEVAAAVAAPLRLEFEAGLLPEQKIRTIERLQREGRTVAMIGDGINDAPALARADVGIAIGVAGSDAAIEAAHVALMRDDWGAVPEAILIGRRAFRTIQQNLWFTAAYNIVGIALAATQAGVRPSARRLPNRCRTWR